MGDNVVKGFNRLLYATISDVFGPSEDSSFLTLQSPTRHLSKDEYAFNADGVCSGTSKPASVAEAEFRLTDALYDPRPIVAGPNGKSLSTVFQKALDNMIPLYSEKLDKSVTQHRENIRNWLLKETRASSAIDYDRLMNDNKGESSLSSEQVTRSFPTDEKRAVPRKMTRMEFAQSLMEDYDAAKSQWERDKAQMAGQAVEKRGSEEVEKIKRELTQTEIARITEKYDDAVARGYRHIVRESMAQLGVSSIAETLEDAKMALRESALSSLYGASRVHPVIMSPGDWFEDLDTDVALEDLEHDPIKLPSIDALTSGVRPKRAEFPWREVVVDSSDEEKLHRSPTSSTADHPSWDAEVWLREGARNSMTDHPAAACGEARLKVRVEMQVTLVTVDRSSWYQPQFLDNSRSFMKSDDTASWNNFPDEIKHSANFISLAATAAMNPSNPCDVGNLPCYPTGYILCKNVVIKLSGMTISTAEQKEYYERRARESVGFLCFSYDLASQKTDAKLSVGSDGIVMRIPGPQILGYIQQVAPPDLTLSFGSTLALQPDLNFPGDGK